MQHFKKSAIVFALTASLAGATGLAFADDAILNKREQAMKGMGAQMKVIKDLIANGGPAAEIGGPAQKIADIAATIPALFPEGSGGDDALPGIWENFDDFTAKAQNLGNEAGLLVSAADGGDMATVGAQFDKVGGACGACHKPYRD